MPHELRELLRANKLEKMGQRAVPSSARAGHGSAKENHRARKSFGWDFVSLKCMALTFDVRGRRSGEAAKGTHKRSLWAVPLDGIVRCGANI
ncbi:hypothetical protein GCM10025770_32540 [Viridibacterium curvum]|uniref:Uncharacterized protein n=1 Tax=Viridibacterium curvum TaxID=1101404 RepID=A0ABP9R071_9RHOO